VSERDESRSRARVVHAREIPDRIRVTRYERAPEIGPRVLFFSGGTALRRVSRVLTRFTHNSVHLITPFDSGGSSAKIRQAFPIISVGDLRNRLMALADTQLQGHPEVYELFAHRFPDEGSNTELRGELANMVEGRHSLVLAVAEPMRKLVRVHLGFFAQRMPLTFDLRGASIGNLILAGGYINNDNDIEAVLFLFSKLVAARGVVRPVIDRNLHLAAELQDGSIVVGQHRLTSRREPIPAPIRRLMMSSDVNQLVPTPHVGIERGTAELIERAELIVFPIGSFYTSLLANLLPRGVGRSVARAGCPRVYVPNIGPDPEQLGLATADLVRILVDQLRADFDDQPAPERLIDFVLVDSRGGDYQGGLDFAAIEATGAEIIDVPLVSDRSAPHHDASLLVEALLSLV
jgi:CofD-related protein of GAK system